MFKATITSKGQLTVPKEIRSLLKLETGDGVVFKIAEGNVVTFEKSNEFIECPVCKGYGSFNINELPCFFCDQSKQINTSQSIWQLIGNIMSNSLKYGISVTIITQEISSNGQFIERQIPKLTLQSKRYFEQSLDTAHDYLQMKLIEENAPRSLQNPEKFMSPTDLVLNEILSLLKRDEAKETVRKWFRYERNVFSISEDPNSQS